MKFERVEIRNLKAIEHIRLDRLSDLVLIAGPNGAGKSCILDGLRLLKSVYGGYHHNEIRNWFGEFSINLANKSDFKKLFRDQNKPLTVSADVQLTTSEISYLRTNAESLVRELAWRTVAPEVDDPHVSRRASLAKETRVQSPEVDARVLEDLPAFLAQLEMPLLRAALTLRPDGRDEVEQNLVLEVVWGTYDPENLGIIDFHSANRRYDYEQVGSINLNIQDTNQRVKQHALYMTQNKYSNIKSEMAAAFVRDLISKQGGGRMSGPESTIETLKELFSRFFPGKEFMGPVPAADGSLSFPVKLISDDTTHDIDYLSSGEKEVLFGYLRLRNSAPKNSVIMIDEPELHLNPRLVKGLPGFYDEYIGKALGNQVWLVTHSDAFLRDGISIPSASVWHMQEVGPSLGDNGQAVAISRESDIDRAIVDLVGDLAGYKPGATIVIVEGEDSEFDQEMISRLFPTISSSINLISAGSRSRVERLHSLLMKATETVGWNAKFFAITDQDVDPGLSTGGHSGLLSYHWDVYHIENYLLEPLYLHAVMDDLAFGRGIFGTVEKLEDELRDIAANLVDDMVRIEMNREVKYRLDSAIVVGSGRRTGCLTDGYVSSVRECLDRLGRLAEEELSEGALGRREAQIRSLYETSIVDGSWRKRFRGRDILARFAAKNVKGVRYENFRNLVISKMRSDGFQPIGMRTVLESCLVGNSGTR